MRRASNKARINYASLAGEASDASEEEPRPAKQTGALSEPQQPDFCELQLLT